MEGNRFRGEKPKKPQGKEQLSKVLRQIAGMSWVVWAFILAAALNFGVAIFYGSLSDLVACILILVGMTGAVKSLN